MSTDLREVVAKVLCDRLGSAATWDELTDADRPLWLAEADAVLEALAGQLVPEHEARRVHSEWAVDHNNVRQLYGVNEDLARHVAHGHGWQLMRRDLTTYDGPWTEAS